MKNEPMLFLEADPPHIRCTLIGEGRTAAESFTAGFDERKNRLGGIVGSRKIGTVGYRLLYGGNVIGQPVMRAAKALRKLEEAVRFAPDKNRMTKELVLRGLRLWPKADHVLLCESAFFSALPESAAAFGIPYEFLQQGIRKYGHQGLAHAWAWERAKSFSKRPLHRLISVFLGDRTNIAAILDGRPVEVSDGFSDHGGIVSASGCGNIDLSLIFRLVSEDIPVERVRRMLVSDSGFRAIAGKSAGLSSVLAGQDRRSRAAAEVYRYQLCQQLGGHLAALGGTDMIVFMGDAPEEPVKLAAEIVSRLGFMGARSSDIPQRENNARRLVLDRSAIDVLYFEIDPWDILMDKTRKFLS